jgi:hypothetical protein
VSTLKAWKLENLPYPLLGLVGGTLGRRYCLLARPMSSTEGGAEIARMSRRGFSKMERGEGSARQEGESTMKMDMAEGDVLEIDNRWFIR